jgi:hypothetical protein
MGIRFVCPNGHKLNVKSDLAGKRAICPHCSAKVIVPEGEEPAANEVSRQVVGVAPGNGFDTANADSVAVASWPSIEISLAPSEVAPPAPSRPATPAADPNAIPASILSTSPAPAPEPAPVLSPQELRELAAERRRRNQILMSVMLLMIVITLAGVLCWVLYRDRQRQLEPPPEEQPSARSEVGATSVEVADCIRRISRRTSIT